jgi:SlyX protein
MRPEEKHKMREERLIEIETKLAFQEKTIKDLNDVICEQQQEIERLGAICDLLVKQNKEFSQSAPGITAPANEKPPHY